eukprot:gene2650-3331_t
MLVGLLGLAGSLPGVAAQTPVPGAGAPSVAAPVEDFLDNFTMPEPPPTGSPCAAACPALPLLRCRRPAARPGRVAGSTSRTRPRRGRRVRPITRNGCGRHRTRHCGRYVSALPPHRAPALQHTRSTLARQCVHLRQSGVCVRVARHAHSPTPWAGLYRHRLPPPPQQPEVHEIRPPCDVAQSPTSYPMLEVWVEPARGFYQWEEGMGGGSRPPAPPTNGTDAAAPDDDDDDDTPPPPEEASPADTDQADSSGADNGGGNATAGVVRQGSTAFPEKDARVWRDYVAASMEPCIAMQWCPPTPAALQ